MKKLIVIGIFLTIMVIDCYGQWIENDSNLSTSDNVSIGTNNRERTLHVYGSGMIQSYSPRLTLRRSTDNGGFIQGIQTELENGDANFFYGNLHNSTWLVSKGNYSGKRLFTIKSDGKVGIGTSTPDHKLDVNGDIRVNQFVLDGGWIKMIRPQTTGGWARGLAYYNTISENRMAGIGIYGGGEKVKSIYIAHGSSCWSSGKGIYIKPNGYTGIGTTTPDYKLDVNGTIRSKEIKVETGWSDFVFEEDYNLKSLEELENYISHNKHLPNIPTEAEVKENGINLGEMNAKLLQKIEELTLYTIQQQKEIKKLKAENKLILELKNRVDLLENNE